jgi:DNA-binding response OmpR family regulator
MSYLLCVDDDDDLRLTTSRVLEAAGYQVETTMDGPSTLELVEKREPALIVLDLQMPGMSGLEVCRTIKENPFTSHIPILMLTALSDIEHKVEGFEAGADDYLGKPFLPRELQARVAALLRMVRREGDRNPSSGLPGGQAIQEAIGRWAARGAPFAICYIDLDHFKPFADTFGFTVADIVIRETAATIRGAVEAVGNGREFAGHIGGDDFIVVTSGQNAEPLMQECAARFGSVVSRAVGEAAVQRGSYMGIDREGQTREFPITQLSAVILIIDPAHWASLTESIVHLGSFVAEMKRHAKQSGPGSILMRTME